MKTTSHHKTTMVVVLGLFSLFLMIQDGHAYQFKVGGSGDWSLASCNSYDQWAHQSRFQIGDTVLFNYEANKDSLVQVSETDYKNCSTASPIAKYSDGHTAVKLTQSGPHFFISGNVDHCKNNEKVMIVVMADRSNRSSAAPSSPPSAAPSPPPSATPSPPPASEDYPSPPPAPSTPETDLTPAPGPSDENHPPPTPNGASLTVTNFLCSVGAFGGFSVLFGF
ncbi:early nodulin-like protein 1 [Cynara cardunculus var. scolymus]|uniref:Cupredoxin n=1 Tax=Cynara cardunculus var. scolymus TaxID=59895 RepID=A0A103Y4D2_CYNCS|nr:early nodulin-like protein 1 [Cynara cardunculus var. scolymus]KVI02299.1 Cupredoxin [Cynara cardunculus var. scolymus]